MKVNSQYVGSQKITEDECKEKDVRAARFAALHTCYCGCVDAETGYATYLCYFCCVGVGIRNVAAVARICVIAGRGKFS